MLIVAQCFAILSWQTGTWKTADLLELTLQHTTNTGYGWGSYYVEIEAGIAHCGGGCPGGNYHRKMWMNAYCSLYDADGGGDHNTLLSPSSHPMGNWEVTRAPDGHNGHNFDCTLLRVTHTGKVQNVYASIYNLISAGGLDYTEMSSYDHLSVTKVNDDGEGDAAVELKLTQAGCCTNTGSINSAARTRFGNAASIPTSGRGYVSISIKGTAKYTWLKPSVYAGAGWVTLLPQDGGSEYITSEYRTFGNYVVFGTGSGGPNPGFSITQDSGQHLWEVGSAAYLKNPYVADASADGNNFPAPWFVRIRPPNFLQSNFFSLQKRCVLYTRNANCRAQCCSAVSANDRLERAVYAAEINRSSEQRLDQRQVRH